MNSDDNSAVAQLQAIAETTPDVLITIDTHSRIQFVNPAVSDVFGYTPDELVGKTITTLMSDDLGTRFLQAVERYLSTGTRHLDWDDIEFTGKHKDGTDVPLRISFSEFTHGGDRYFAGILRDITDQKELKAERDLLHRARDQVIEADTFSEGLRNTLTLLGESMNWVYGEAWVPDDDNSQLEWEAGWAASDHSLAGFRERSEQRTFEPGDGLVGRVWQTQEYEWIADVSTAEEAVFGRTTAASEYGLKAALGVPIQANGRVVAVMVYLMTEERAVDARMVEVTRAVSSNLGLLMARRQAESALRHDRDLIANILKTSPTGIVVIDVDGELTYANGRAEEVLHIQQDEHGEYPTYEALPLQTLTVDGRVLSEAELPYHYVLRTGQTISRDVQVEYDEGGKRWLSVNGAPLRDDDGRVTSTVFSFEDITDWKRQTDQLERLHQLGQALSDAETFDEACEHAVTAAHDVLELSVSSIELYNSDTGHLEPCSRTREATELAGDESLFASEQSVAWQAFVRKEPHVYGDLLRETDLDHNETALSCVIILPLANHGVFISGSTEPAAFSDLTVTLANILVKHTATTFDRLEREVSLRNQKSELETTNDRLRRVQRVNQEIRDITQALMDAESSDEIKQLVCDRLANSDPYRFVWFGERDFSTDEIVPTAWAGVEDGYLDAVTVTADHSETGEGPGGRAIRTGEPQIQNNLQSDPPFEPWRQEAMQRGYRASIAVPVLYQGTFYGVLNLYANESGVFTEMEQAVLSELGEMIGYALNAMERYDALVSEDSVELEFVIRDTSDPLLTFLRENEGEFRLENIPGRDGDTMRVFGAFEDIPFETVESFSRLHSGVERVTLIRDRSGETIVELTISQESFIVSLMERGAVLTSIRGTPTEGRIELRIAQSASVREFVELFEDRYDDVELVALRESPEPVQTREEFENLYLERLTERQQEVLRTAYFAGFFEQPRAKTAEEVADILDVSQPTISRHIRSGEQKLFSLLFGDGEQGD